MNAPELTLLIPCYNAARFLPQLAADIAQLTVPFSKILCYDDGSTDDTVAVAQQLGWTILTPNPNGGVAVARNRLAAAATTTWIHFHDADDRIDPRFVEKLGVYCDEHYDVISCDADWIDDDAQGRLQIPWRYDASVLAREPHLHLLQNAMGLNNSVIRRTAWNSVNGCDESLAIWEDADLHIRLAQAGARWRHVSEVLTRSLRRAGSFSHDYVRGWRCRLATLEKYAANSPSEKITAILANEAEKAAGELASLGADPDAQRAVKLCRQLGSNPPSSHHLFVRALKPFVSAVTLLRWQNRRRQVAR